MNFTSFGGSFPSVSLPSISHFASKDETATASSASPNFDTITTLMIHASGDNEINNRTFGEPHQQFTLEPGALKFQPISVHQGNQNQSMISINASQLLQGNFETIQAGSQSGQDQSRTQEYPSDGSQQTNQEKGQLHHTLQPTWQLTNPGSTVVEYLSHLPASTLPINLHQFFKISTEPIKKEPVQQGNATQQTQKKKKKRRPPKDKAQRPTPGGIRITTALDGTLLFCCPECQMGYREKEMLEQHLVSHKLERRFICDICGAGLKRKDHLTRHKHSHNPERPFVCTICSKAFKRKEQLTLHFVIHSGEKRHICPECNKGFYRKDHLRKHMRSHMSRSVKAEISKPHTVQTRIIN